MEPRERRARCIAGSRSGLQVRKSASTRQQILDSALECLLEAGYAATSTTMVVERAAVSRGALLHHYPSRIDLIRAVVEYLYAKRLRAFRVATMSAPVGPGRLRRVLDTYWEQIQHPLYRVFLELAILSRTEPDLARILAPIERSFDLELRRMARELFPEWRDLGDPFESAFEFCMLVMEGVALSMVQHGRVLQKERVLRFLVQQIQEIAGREL